MIKIIAALFNVQPLFRPFKVAYFRRRKSAPRGTRGTVVEAGSRCTGWLCRCRWLRRAALQHGCVLSRERRRKQCNFFYVNTLVIFVFVINIQNISLHDMQAHADAQDVPVYILFLYFLKINMINVQHLIDEIVTQMNFGKEM